MSSFTPVNLTHCYTLLSSIVPGICKSTKYTDCISICHSLINVGEEYISHPYSKLYCSKYTSLNVKFVS